MCSTVDLVGVRGRAAAVEGRMNAVSSLFPFCSLWCSILLSLSLEVGF